MLKAYLKHAVALGALVAGASASAQSAAPAVQNSAELSGNEADGQFGDIVVTARKREESLRDVPIAVTAISGDALKQRGITEVKNLFATVPGLFFSQAGQRKNDEQFFLTLRGVGSSPVVEPSVGVFIDGVYIPSLGWTSEFNDIDRVEILRGPQGALFGRNTQAGALNITTRKPGPAMRGDISAEVAEFHTYRVAGAVSGPLSENLGVGLSAYWSKTDGFMRNVTRNEPQDNRNRAGVRGIARLTPSDRTEIIVSADYMRSRGRFDAFGDAVANQAVIVVNPQDPLAARGTFLRSNLLAGRRYTTYGDAESTVRSRNWGASATLNHDLGFAELTDIVAFRKVDSKDSYDQDWVATGHNTNAAVERQRIYSNELRLISSRKTGLTWIAGAYAFNENLVQRRTSLFPANSGTLAGPVPGSTSPGFVQDNVEISRKGIAAFGQASYEFLPRLTASVGLRYSYEKVRQTPDGLAALAITPPGIILNVINNVQKRKSFDGFSPSGTLTYKASDDLTLYASIATGYKAGGFTRELPNTAGANQPLQNETSLNYEVGLKGQAFDRRVRFDVALFYTDLKDQQLSTRVELTPGSNVYIPSVRNVGAGHAKGVEVEVQARPVRPLLLQANASYTSTRFDDYIASPATLTLPAYDRSGQTFPEVPKWLISASAQYAVALSDNVTLTPQLSWRYVDSTFVGQGTAAVPFIPLSSYNTWDAQLALAAGRWELTAYVKNLTDKYYFVYRSENQLTMAVPGRADFAKPGAPRQFGLRASYKF